MLLKSRLIEITKKVVGRMRVYEFSANSRSGTEFKSIVSSLFCYYWFSYLYTYYIYLFLFFIFLGEGVGWDLCAYECFSTERGHMCSLENFRKVWTK